MGRRAKYADNLKPSKQKTEESKSNHDSSAYQLRLLLHFMKRAINNGLEFQLTLERFENIMLRGIDGASEQEIHRFLHVADLQDKFATINESNLLNDGSQFGVQKCYISYREILQNPQYRKSFKAFIVCTQANVDDNIKEWFQEVSEQDSILNYGTQDSKRLKFVKTFAQKENLIAAIIESSDLFVLTTKLAKCVLENKTVSMEDAIFRKYNVVLGTKVVDSDHPILKEHSGFKKKQQTWVHYFVKFREEFFTGGSSELTTFKEAFVRAYQTMSRIDETEIWEKLKTVELRVTQGFLKKAETRWTDLPSNKISTDEIEQFFDVLVFAVKQPSLEELNAVIGDEMGEHWLPKAIDNEIVSSVLQRKLLNWIKVTHKNSTFKHPDGLAFLEQVKYYIHKMGTTFPGISCELKMKHIGLVFSKQLAAVVEFLYSSEKQVLNIRSPHSVELTALKVYQTVMNVRPHEQNSYVCATYNCLLDMGYNAIARMSTKQSLNLLLIECRPMTRNNDTKHAEMCVSVNFHLKSFLNLFPHRKILLITKGENMLANEFKKEFSKNYKECVDETGNLMDLESPEKLLDTKNIIFQGSSVPLKQAVDGGSLRLVNDEIISRLIANHDVLVGQTQPDLRELSTVYCRSSRKVKVEQLRETLLSTDHRHVLVIDGFKDKQEVSQWLSVCSNKVMNSEEIPDIWDGNCVVVAGADNGKQLEKFKKICNRFDHGDFPLTGHFIEKICDEVTWNYSYEAFCYIPRNFNGFWISCETLRQTVEQESSRISNKRKTIFAISGLNNANKLLGNTTQIENITRDGCVFMVNLGNTTFDDLCRSDEIKEYNIHWFQNEKDELRWVRSRGSVRELRDLFGESSKQLLTDEVTLLNQENMIIIAGEPGSGKSTTLKYLTKKLKNSEWVVFLNLESLRNKIEWMKGDYSLNSIVKNFFSQLNTWGMHEFSQGLLEHRIRQRGKVTLIFDGFDELESKHQDKVIQILKSLRFTKARIIASTRNSAKHRLENALGVLAWTLVPLTDEQIQFSSNRWTSSLKLMQGDTVDEQVLTNYADKLSRNFHKSIRSGKYDLIGIPLLLQIITDIHQSCVEDFCLSNNTLQDVDTMCILDVYEKFVQRKHDICVREKLPQFQSADSAIKNIRTSIENHRNFAVWRLFGLSQTESFSKALGKKQKCDLEPVGIVQNGRFIHRTFGEYFVADLLISFLKDRRDEGSPDYGRTVEFLLLHIPRKSFRPILKFMTEKVEKERDDLLRRRWIRITSCNLSENVPITFKMNITDALFQGETKDFLNMKEITSFDLPDKIEMKSLSVWQYYTDEYFCNDKMKIVRVGELFKDIFPVEYRAGITQTFYVLKNANLYSHYKSADKVCEEFLQIALFNYFKAVPKQEIISESKFMKEPQSMSTEPLVREIVDLLEQLKCKTNVVQKLGPIQKLVNLLIPHETQTAPSDEVLKTLSFLFLYISLFHPAVPDLLKSYISSSSDTKRDYLMKIIHFASKIPCELLSSQTTKALRDFLINLCHSEDTKYFLVETFEGKDPDWLSREGLSIICFLEILTPEMAGRFREQSVSSNDTNWESQFIAMKYLLDGIQQDRLPHVDKSALITFLMGCLQRFLGSNNSQNAQLTFTDKQLQTMLGLLSEALISSDYSLAEYVRNLNLLANAGLSLIDFHGEILIADPESDFQFKMTGEYVAEAIQRFYRLKDNVNELPEVLFSNRYNKIVKSEKRPISDDVAEESKRRKFNC
ncbi:uncharacterized protein LOC131430640 [Malaya genurostris]|uniref:uncharacterized protein LOC131430640 n=1 Tax=Malaya genurostris TaxID=325434 RepID=UPI0026F3D248|nr:uncharacterized protein LOC131430640 [Malaya genurostris]XP_058451733.1 uncharacterized protein LOC131430640 [Malaya genurostris]XP_058451734.1 uncharacterized protein LOC131430640 [Malaya genurostris]